MVRDRNNAVRQERLSSIKVPSIAGMGMVWVLAGLTLLYMLVASLLMELHYGILG